MDDGVTEQHEESTELGDAELFAKLKRWYLQDVAKARAWREVAREDYRFYNGEHWTEEEKKALQDLNRPSLTFNRPAVLVNAVVGNEISNRREVNFFPREEGDAKANELLGSAAEWFRDNCNAEDEESEAFEDLCKGGMGWTETRMDFDENPDGDGIIERIDPFEMVWDASAVKANITDATRVFRVREMTIEQARVMFPDQEDHCLHAAWAMTAEKSESKEQPLPSKAYDGDGVTLDETDKVHIVEAQWFEYEPFYRAAIPDPTTGQSKIVELDVTKFKLLKKAAPGIKAVKQRRRKVMKAFMGSEFLDPVVESLCPTHFTYQAMTGYRDEENGYWYGIIRPTKDPAKWANKFLSQIIHVLNTSAKGGIMAEKGAFDNVRQAEESWAKSDQITWLKDNALQSGKVEAKPITPLPTGFFQLMEYAVNSIRDVTGINLELMGMREATQSGVLEMQRREAGQIMLAKLFNGLRRYRKIQGRVLLYIIQNYLSDGRLVRILGDQKGQYAKLVKPEKTDLQYDIIVDDAPSSPNEKERTWGVLVQMLPMLKDQITPEIALEFMTYSPLPASMVEKLKEAYKKKMEAEAQDPEAQERKALEKSGAEATVRKTQGEAELKLAQAKKTNIEAAVLPHQAQAEALAALVQLSQPRGNPAPVAP